MTKKSVSIALLGLLLVGASAYALIAGAVCTDRIVIERCYGSTSPVHEFACPGDREVYKIQSCGGVLREVVDTYAVSKQPRRIGP